MAKSKTKKPAAAKKRGRGAVAKTTKKSKEPSSLSRCPYASAEFCIERGGGDNEDMYWGKHPATSTPACGKLLQFKVPRKWLDINVDDFQWYDFFFTLHYKQDHSHTPRVYTRTQVINQDDEVKELVRRHTRARLKKETTAEYAEDTWKGDASTVRIAVRRKPRQNWKYQVKFLEASLQLGADGTVPESEFGPGPGEGSDDDDLSSEDTYGQRLSPEAAKARRARGIYYK